MYVIKKDGVVVSHNSRELKRKIKNGKMPDGMYDYVNRKGQVCFQVEYKTVGGSNTSTRVAGMQFDTAEGIQRRVDKKAVKLLRIEADRKKRQAEIDIRNQKIAKATKARMKEVATRNKHIYAEGRKMLNLKDKA